VVSTGPLSVRLDDDGMRRGVRALRRLDPSLGPWIDRIGPIRLPRATSHFRSLFRAILSQQLSNRAAKTICGRALALFESPARPHPEELLAIPDPALRAAGVSAQKVGYVRDLARSFVEGDVDPRRLSRMDDEGVIDALVGVKGVGRWTAEMFLIFSLRRPDVFSPRDLALVAGTRRLAGDAAASPARCGELAARWAPWRSVASLYLWRIAHWR